MKVLVLYLQSLLDQTTLDVIVDLFHSSTVKIVMCDVSEEGGTDCGSVT